MTMEIESLPVPLRVDEHGVVRVGHTRVTLSVLMFAYHEGASPEEIVDRFPTLALADVYGTIYYYLHYREQVDAYLRQYDREAEETKRQIEARWPRDGLRERLLARLSERRD